MKHTRLVKTRKRPKVRFGSVRFGGSVFFRRLGSVRFGGKFKANHRIFCLKNGQESSFFSHLFSIIPRKLYGFQCKFFQTFFTNFRKGPLEVSQMDAWGAQESNKGF